MITFWKWLVFGVKSAPSGWLNVFNKWLILHVIIAFLCLYLINADAYNFASKALFPASSVLVGLSMAWTTRASTVLQSKELRATLFNESRPAEDYIYGFQLSIMIVMIMVAYIACMAGGGIALSVFGSPWDQHIAGFWMYLLISLSLRECWGVVNFTNMLSLLDYTRNK